MCSTIATAAQHPRIPKTSNPVQHSSGIETWAQNLASPFDSQLNQTNLNSFEQNSQLIDPQPLFPLNYQSSHSHSSANVNLSTFWDSNAELWFATAEHAFSAHGIVIEHKRISMVLASLDLKFIQKIQHVVRSPTNHPYQDIKKALIKTFKLNENDRFAHFVQSHVAWRPQTKRVIK